VTNLGHEELKKSSSPKGPPYLAATFPVSPSCPEAKALHRATVPVLLPSALALPSASSDATLWLRRLCAGSRRLWALLGRPGQARVQRACSASRDMHV
jgi:hypothetical protein